MSQLTVEQKEQLVELFYNVPTKQQTLEMCEVAIEDDVKAIKKVSKRLLSEELCIKAINIDPEAFFLLGKEQMTPKVLYSLFKKLNDDKIEREQLIYDLLVKFNRFKNIEFGDLLTKEVALEMVRFDGNAITHCSKELRADLEILTLAAKTSTCPIRFIPKEKQTKELVLNSIEGGASVWDIDSRLIDDEVADALMRKKGEQFRSLPSDKQTYERCLMAVKSGLKFEQISETFHTQEIFDTLVEANGDQIGQIPEKYIHRDMLLTVAKNSPGSFRELKTVKDGLMDETLACELVRLGASITINWIGAFQTKETAEIAVGNDAYDLFFVEPKFITKELLNKAVAKDYNVLNLLPEEYVDEELCYVAVLCGATLDERMIRKYQSERIIDFLITNNHYFRFNPFAPCNNPHDSILKVKEEFRTRDFFKKVFMQNTEAIEAVPEEMIDEELCYLAVCGGASLHHDCIVEHQSQRIVDEFFDKHGFVDLERVKEEFVTDDMIEKVIKKCPSQIQHVPTSKLTEELCFKVIKTDWEVLQYIENQTIEMCMLALEQNPRAEKYFKI